MATNVTVNSEFVGVASKDLFLEIFKKAETFAKNLITVAPNVIGSYFLPNMSYTSEMKLVNGCGWVPGGSVGLSDKEIVTKKYHISNELCKEDFAKTFQAQNGGLFSAHSEIPTDIKEGILLMMTNNAAYTIDNEIWNGSGATNSFNGLITQFLADGDVLDVAGATAINKGNVVAELEKVDDLIPSELDGKTDLVWVVSRNVGKAYQRALAAQGQNTTAGSYELDYMGVRMEVVSTLENNTIIVYEVENLHFATGLESDLHEIKVIDSDATNLDGIIKHKIQFLAGVGYVDGSRVVLYKG